MAIDTVLEVTGFPVNELGEVVLQAGVGTSSIVGTLSGNFVPRDNVTDRMVVKLPRLYYGSNVATMGDSIYQQGTYIGSGSYNYQGRGSVIWMLCYLGWPWEFQPDDNFAVFGTTTDVVIAGQLPALLEAHKNKKFSRVFVSCGTNDTYAATYTLDQIQTNMMSLFTTLRANNIIPVHTGIRPRGADTSGTYTLNPASTAAKAKLMNVALNEWLFQLSLTGFIEFIPTSEVFADNSTAYGNCLPTLMYDSVLHPNQRGAAFEGKVLADYYLAMGVTPQLKFALQQNDVLDRTYNSSGVIFTLPNPLLQGSVADALGVKPTGMSVAGTGSTWSKVIRTLTNGQTRSDPSCALAATALHSLYDDVLATSGQPWATNSIQPGDVLEARSKIVVTNGVNINNVRLLVSVSDGTTAFTHSCLFSDTSTIPDGSYTLYLKTPRFTVPAYSGTGQQSVYIRTECTTATGSGTFTVQALEVRKVS